MISLNELRSKIDTDKIRRPRILLTDEVLEKVFREIETCVELRRYNDLMMEKADEYLGLDCVEHKKTGKRLLHVSREAFSRISTLGWAYLYTREKRYALRAINEMLSVSRFKDWNPSHFLDVAEMTAGLAIGYDWLYDQIGDTDKNKIKGAIINLGLKESFLNLEGNCWWITAEHNWNQVCHGGMVLGALAIIEDEKELSTRVVHRALENIAKPMDEYYPDGAYPEGPSYWSYGTSYNILMIEALRTSLGTAFNLNKHKGLLESAEYYLFATGPSGSYWNYADSEDETDFNPLVYWFIRETNKNYLGWNQEKMLKKNLAESPESLVESRMSALTLLWRKKLIPEVPKKLSWVGRGRTPVAIFRDGWKEDSLYLAVKGGSAKNNHAHMDGGSFILEASGIRWALDLGREEYNRIEEMGIDLWNMGQESERWKLFRYNNKGHNTLTLNGKDHRISGFGDIIDTDSSSFAAFDLTDYFDDINEVTREVKFDPEEKYPVQIKDTFISETEGNNIRWQMATKADISEEEKDRVILTHEGKKMEIRVFGTDIEFEVFQEARSSHGDSENKGVKFIGFNHMLNKGNKEFKIGMRICK